MADAATFAAVDLSKANYNGDFLLFGLAKCYIKLVVREMLATLSFDHSL